MKPLRLLWAVRPSREVGGGYGYRIHATKMIEALTAAGVTITYDPAERCDIAVHLIGPGRFQPIPGKVNLHFTTCEMTRPTEPLSAVADILVVPCRHNLQVFREAYPGLNITVCPEGVDCDLFPFIARQSPGPDVPFRFLFVGEMRDARKGVNIIVEAWEAWQRSGRMPTNAQLYLKTTGVAGIDGVHYHCANGGQRVPYYVSQGFVIDGRDLPGPDLATLYATAHAFVSASFGEGWFLPLTEAMASGLPAIWTAFGAPAEYGDDSVGFPVTRFEMTPHWAYPKPPDVGEPDYYGAHTDPAALVERMQEIVDDYPAALERGRLASMRMHDKFTWAHAAARFIEICDTVLGAPKVAGT